MCDIFPEVYTCFYFISVRVGMLLISVLAIVSFASLKCLIFCVLDNTQKIGIGMTFLQILMNMTGVITLSTMQLNSKINYERVQILVAIREPEDALKNLNTLVTSGICMMSCVFMFTGLLLLFGTLTDNDGLIQIFVWLTFLNIIFGYLLVIGVGYECLTQKSCTLSKLDWLSGSALLVLVVGYLSLWIYFISIANSYVMSVNV